MPLRTSVVIPTYNRAHIVGRAIRSALSQTLAPDEVLVVDDGSTDDTAAVVNQIAGPVHYIPKLNGGVSSARNLGFERATGDCVFLLDSDDFWASTWIEKAVRVLEGHPECGAVCANIRDFDERGNPGGETDFSRLLVDDVIPVQRLFGDRMGLGSNLCVRSDLVARLGGFDQSLDTAEDIDFGLRLAAIAGIRLVREPLICVTLSPSSLSHRVNTGNRLRVLDKFEQVEPALAKIHAGELKKARAAIALSYARDLTWARRLPEARKRALEAWHHAPSWPAVRQILKISALSLLGAGGKGRP